MFPNLLARLMTSWFRITSIAPNRGYCRTLTLIDFRLQRNPMRKIIRQAILLTVGQYFLQREEVGPNFHQRSHLTAEKLLAGIRTRQLGD